MVHTAEDKLEMMMAPLVPIAVLKPGNIIWAHRCVVMCWLPKSTDRLISECQLHVGRELQWNMQPAAFHVKLTVSFSSYSDKQEKITLSLIQ